jgi:hypothetical protein
MKNTNEVLEGYLNCKTKGGLKLAGEGGTRSDYFPVGSRYEYATTHLEEFARTITSADELIVQQIAERLCVMFQPDGQEWPSP